MIHCKKTFPSTSLRVSGLSALLAVLGLAALPSRAALIAHYEFEGTGQTVTDSASSGGFENGVLGTSGSSESTDPTRVGGELSFDGVDDRVTIADDDDLSILESGDSGTIAFFFTANSVHDGHAVNKQKEYSVSFQDDAGELTMRFALWGDNSDSASTFPGGATAISTGVRHHAAVSFTAGTGGTLYLDGQVYNTYSSTDVSDNDPTQPLRLGANIGSKPEFDTFFDGTIDDVRIYDEALSQSGIQAIVPEPSTWILVGLSFGSLPMLVRRRRRDV